MTGGASPPEPNPGTARPADAGVPPATGRRPARWQSGRDARVSEGHAAPRLATDVWFRGWGAGRRKVRGQGVGARGAGMAGGRRGDRQSALSRRQAAQRPPRGGLRLAPVHGLPGPGAGGGRSGLLLVREGRRADEGGPGEARRAGLDQLHPGRGEPAGLAGRDPGVPDLRGMERRAVGGRGGGGAGVPGVLLPAGAGGCAGAGRCVRACRCAGVAEAVRPLGSGRLHRHRRAAGGCVGAGRSVRA